MKRLEKRALLLVAAIILLSLVLPGCGKPDIERLKSSGDAAGLIRALAYEGPEEGRVVPAAQEALRQLGPAAVEPLIEAITSKNERISSLSMRLLGELKDQRAIDPLVAALDDEDLRDGALFALCWIGDIDTIEVLMKYKEREVVTDLGLVEINVKYIQPVLSGQRVDAAAYRPGTSGTHPVVIADEKPFFATRLGGFKGDPENWNALMPVSWRALGEPRSVELVLCWDKIEHLTLETTVYGNGAKGTRTQQKRTVSLRAAATGEVVATAALKGGKPPLFQGFIGESDDQDFFLDGGFEAEILIEWLRPFVEIPAS